MLRGVSIIVCCYNSVLRLPETLRHLALQEVASDIPWEVIVVNNASTDDTSVVATKEWGKHLCNTAFKVVDQPIQGLSAAREKGIETSAYEYVIFCDDDNWLASDWVQKVYEIFESNPEIGILGGCNTAVFEISPPEWFEQVKESFAVGKQHHETADITGNRAYVWGAGMAFRKSVYFFIRKCGFNPLLTGRKGKKLTAGEDTEFCILFRMAGYRIWYFDNLKLKHFIPSSRMNVKLLSKMYRGFGESRYFFDMYELIIKNSKYPFFHLYYNYSIDLVRITLQTSLLVFKANRKTNLTFLYFWFTYQKQITAYKNIFKFKKYLKLIRSIKYCLNK